ncbi:MAG: ASCH domain-containing protein [Desulfurococcaceae archaeon TW002]
MRKTLIFKKEYGRNIILGKKTSTIRLRSNIRKGDIVDVRVGDVHVGKAIIEDVITKKISELTDADARNDGFKNREDLLNELRKIYGKQRIRDDTEIKLIKFRLLDLT